ncbi:hypothetical protein [Cupriavidus sp. CuC1]|uniref:hypothetical protein n=1 Tax=Cupriavidus sp. CuC1 TaxID=3373131 RepID=UPI0037D31DE9
MSTNDLNFHKSYTPPAGGQVALNFTLNPDGVPTTAVVRLVKSAPTLRIVGDAEKAVARTATVTMALHTVQTLHVRASYANNVFRGPSSTPASVYEMATPSSSAKSSAFEQSASLKAAREFSWRPPTQSLGVTTAIYENALKSRAIAGQVWEAAAPMTTARDSLWKYPPHLKPALASRYESAAPLSSLRGDSWEYPPHLKPVMTLRHEVALPAVRGFGLPAKAGQRRVKTTKVPWEAAKWASYGKESPYVPPEIPGYTSDTALNFICPWLDYAGNDILINFGKYPCKEAEPTQPGTGIIMPVKKVYIVINNVLLRRLDGNVELPTFSLSLSIDADSWTWGFNAALPAAAQDAIEPGSDGTPVELEAVINGTAYRVLAENISRDRSFGQAVIRVSGKGKSAMLGAPYAPILNFGNAQARTAQQLMNDALTINGASIGWTVNWGLTDWLVPSGAWAHQGTYITALNTIAEAAGGYIQPHPTQKQLNVLARYPTAPWSWGSLTPDFELPSDVTTREGIEWVERPRYNRIFVTGEGQGVLGQVTRAGTAGDILAPLVTDALITHADAARQRGLSVLADTGRQAHLSLRLPVLAETGVIQPGKFVRYMDGGTTRIGIVRSTAVEVGVPEVWQTIGVETHVA